MRRPSTVELMLLATIVLWSLNLTMSRYVLTHGFQPLAYSSLRYGLGALIFVALTLLLERSLRLPRPDLVHAVVTAVVVFGNQVAFVYALDRITAVLDEVRPAVRLVVNEHALGSGSGFGTIEGHRDAVPLHAVETGLCEGYLPIRFDDEGRCLDLGREERLFSRKQKTALAVRDGGCMDPDCDRPAAWTEAHHIKHWHRDHGPTDITDGILLCRYHHLLFHNNGWEIRRDGAVYWLIPPPTIDPDQTPRRMRSKTRADILNPVVLGDAASHGVERQHASGYNRP